jgi:hypothetical protein
MATLSWHGHPCFTLVTDDGNRLPFDPWLNGNPTAEIRPWTWRFWTTTWSHAATSTTSPIAAPQDQSGSILDSGSVAPAYTLYRLLTGVTPANILVPMVFFTSDEGVLMEQRKAGWNLQGADRRGHG